MSDHDDDLMTPEERHAAGLSAFLRAFDPEAVTDEPDDVADDDEQYDAFRRAIQPDAERGAM